MKSHFLLSWAISIVLCSSILTLQSQPKIIIGFVVDGFAYHALQKVKPHLTGGIMHLLENGIVYENAYYPHARTNTGPGHATLNTGGLPSYHGIISNKWGTKDDLTIACDDDSDLNESKLLHRSAFSSTKGKSAHNIMVDGLAEQIHRASTPGCHNHTYAISGKSRSAIMMAGKAGKAIWFDPEILQFTSSKAFFDVLPDWLIAFNKNQVGKHIETVEWKPCFAKNSKAYDFMHINDYTYALKDSMIDKQFFLNNDLLYANHFRHMPYGNKLALECAQECLRYHLEQPCAGTLLLWIGLSSLDKVGHTFGPDSFEYIDTIYHVDHYIKEFIDEISNITRHHEIAYFLTADHGFMPIPELIASKRIQTARRIYKNKIIEKINQKVEQHLGIKNIIRCIKAPNVYLYHSAFKQLDYKEKKHLLRFIKHKLSRVHGIRKVWTAEELEHIACNHDLIESLYRKQFFKSRSGHLVFQVDTYTIVAKHPKGSKHDAPYEFNTHVPLLFYQPGCLEKQTMYQKVWMPQVAATISYLLNVPKPSACTAEMLPGITCVSRSP